MINKNLKRKIKRVLDTNKGDRVMNPNYGIDYNFLQDKNLSNLDIKMHILDSLEDNITELKINKIEIQSISPNENKKEISLFIENENSSFNIKF